MEDISLEGNLQALLITFTEIIPIRGDWGAYNLIISLVIVRLQIFIMNHV